MITSNSGGSSTPTSSSGGATTSSSGDNYHNHSININAYGAGDDVRYYGAGFVTTSGGTAVLTIAKNIPHTHTVGNHTHSVSIAAHTHNVSVAAHTHTLTPNIATEYGIYEEPNPSANKLRRTDLTFDINGANIPNTAAVLVDGWAGWWELDLTPYISDVNTFRPLRTVNRLTLGAAASGVGRKAQISGQLVVRTVIRAVAIL